MFSIFRKAASSSFNFRTLNCDMHSHLVPGIDDGAPDMEKAIDFIKGLSEIGYQKIITTPHVMWDIHKNTPEMILNGAKEVNVEIEKRKIPVSFSAAAEYFIDDYFDNLLKKDVPLLTLSGNMVLVEFSIVSEPVELKEILFRMQIKGYQPVIAHPERYLYLGANKQWYSDIKETGCLFQLNILSLTGFYGKAPQQLANYLIRKKYIDLIGTDLHNDRHLEMIQALPSAVTSVISRLVDSGVIQNSKL